MSIRPDSFEQMEAMFEQLRRAAFEPWGAHAWEDKGRPVFPGDSSTVTDNHTVGNARDSIDETDDGYVVLADLPGFEREEIDLTFDDRVLVISATHEVSEDDSFRQRRVRESVRVPADVDVDAAEATYRNGVLEVSLPVDDADDAHTIEIE